MWTRQSHLLSYLKSEFWLKIKDTQLVGIKELITKKMDKHTKKKALAFSTDKVEQFLHTGPMTESGKCNKLIMLFSIFSLGRMEELSVLKWEDVNNVTTQRGDVISVWTYPGKETAVLDCLGCPPAQPSCVCADKEVCAVSTCLGDPLAVCHVDHCGACSAVWSRPDGSAATCSAVLGCAPENVRNCSDLCAVSTCPGHPQALCAMDLVKWTICSSMAGMALLT
eukprot:m51a1_g7111 hypothetical protein (224) ;mRNA; r:74823-84360